MSGRSSPSNMTLPELPRALAAARAFLEEQQPARGLFPTWASPAPDLAHAFPVESPYLTTYILHALAQLAAGEVTPAMSRAGRALWQHREAGGLWRFFGTSAADPPLDFDDTCCALVALGQCRLPCDSKVEHFLAKAAFPGGGYGTWLLTRINAEREVDVVVNANILLHLARSGRPTAELERFLVALVTAKRLRGLSAFAVSELPSLYTLARAYRHGPAPGLAPLLPALIAAVLERRQPDGSFGDELETALAITALATAGHPIGELLGAARWLLHQQRPDGSWPRRVFFRDFRPTYYGSDELTTALGAEALHLLAAAA